MNAQAKAMTGTLSIRDLENLSGIKAHTIRIWEKRYNLFDPDRTETNIRTYSNEDLKKLLNIVSVLDSGMKISKATSLTEEELYAEIESLQSENIEAAKKIIINELIVATLKCDIATFEDIYAKALTENGMDHTVEQIIYPLLIRIGLMWTVSKLNPAQEHFATQMIRQKLFTAIDVLPFQKSDKKYLLYLPDNEDHEIGLLYAYFLIKRAGYECIYLGPSVPLDDVANCVKIAKVSDVLCIFTIPRPEDLMTTYLRKMDELIDCKNLFVSGIQAEIQGNLPGNKFNLLHGVDDLKNIL